MRRQCYAAQVTAAVHDQISTNNNKQAVEKRGELVRASQTPLQGKQKLRCISVRAKCKNGNKAGRKARQKIWEGWLQIYYWISECSKLIHFSSTLSTRQQGSLLFIVLATESKNITHLRTELILENYPHHKIIISFPTYQWLVQSWGWDGKQDRRIISFYISRNRRNSQDLLMVSNNRRAPKWDFSVPLEST